MKQNWKRVADLSIASEGGFTDDPRDRGNWTGGARGKGQLKGTKYGIAANTYGHLDIKNLTRAQAVAIYKKDFWDKISGDRLPSGLDYAVFDYAINSGVVGGVKPLQRIVGVKADGIMGGETLKAIESFPDLELLIKKYLDGRLAFMKRLSTWKVHGKGWTTRVNKVKRIALQMCEGVKVTAEAVDSSPRADKARSEDMKLTSALVEDGEATAQTATGLAVAGTTVSEMAEKIEPITYYAEWAQTIFIGLLVVGMVITVVLMIKKKREGRA
jgi:lysozyme family protein